MRMRAWATAMLLAMVVGCGWAADDSAEPPVAERVTVVDPSGAPVAGARVYVVPVAKASRNRVTASDECHRLRTDARGICDLTGLPHPIAGPLVYVAHTEHPLAALRMTEAAATVRLAPAEVVRGRVFGERWQPIAGARVGPSAVARLEGEALPAGLIDDLSVTSGPDGAFTSPWLLGADVTTLDVSADGYASQRLARAALLKGLRLERLGSLTVEFVAKAPGLTLDGIEMDLAKEGDAQGPPSPQEADAGGRLRCDAGGRGHVEGLRPGKQYLERGEDGLDVWVEEPEVRIRPGEETRIRVEVRPLATVTARIVDQDGEPVDTVVGDSFVTPDWDGGADGILGPWDRDERGRARIGYALLGTDEQGGIRERLPVGVHRIEVCPPHNTFGEPLAAMEITVPPEGLDLGDIRVTPPPRDERRSWRDAVPSRTLTGRVLGPGGEPVRAEIEVLASSRTEEGPVVADAATGAFAVQAPEGEGVVLSVSGNGLTAHSVFVGSEENRLELRLAASREVRVSIVGPDGEGVPARVLAYRTGYVPYIVSEDTRPDGSLTLETAPAKPFLVIAEAGGRSPEWALVDADASEVTLRLSPEPAAAIVTPDFVEYEGPSAEELGRQALAWLEAGAWPEGDPFADSLSESDLIRRALWADPVKAIRLALREHPGALDDEWGLALSILEESDPAKALSAYRTMYHILGRDRLAAAYALRRLGAPGAEDLVRREARSAFISGGRASAAAASLPDIGLKAALRMAFPEWDGGPLPPGAFGLLYEHARTNPAEAVRYWRLLEPTPPDFGMMLTAAAFARTVALADAEVALRWMKTLTPDERALACPQIALAVGVEDRIAAIDAMRETWRDAPLFGGPDIAFDQARTMRAAGHTQWRDQALRDMARVLEEFASEAGGGYGLGEPPEEMAIYAAFPLLPDLARELLIQGLDERPAVEIDGAVRPRTEAERSEALSELDAYPMGMIGSIMPAPFLTPDQRLRATVFLLF